jgi:Fe-S cluster biogenesis protein NfuA
MNRAKRFEEAQAALKYLLPAMQADGGGLELVAVDEGIVRIRLVGACLFCPSRELTLNQGIRRTLLAKLSWLKSVELVP